MTEKRARKLTDRQIEALRHIAEGRQCSYPRIVAVLEERGLIDWALDPRGALATSQVVTDLGRLELERAATEHDRVWDRHQVRMFVREAVDQVGPVGWQFIGPRMREALIEARALRVVTGQMREWVSVRGVEILTNDMLSEAGLTEEK